MCLCGNHDFEVIVPIELLQIRSIHPSIARLAATAQAAHTPNACERSAYLERKRQLRPILLEFGSFCNRSYLLCASILR